MYRGNKGLAVAVSVSSPEIAARARMHADKVLGSGDGGKASLVPVEVRDMMAKNGLDGVEEATVVVVYMGREARGGYHRS